MVLTARIRYDEGSYEGEINDSKNPEGQGTFEYRGDDEDGRLAYEGGWVNKKAEGFGVMRWQNGDRYEGEWKDGLRHGQGSYFCKATAGKYNGMYANDVKNGAGTYKYANGDEYDGEWKDGLRHGEGTYKWLDKIEKYIGEWEGGVKHGKGQFHYANGDVFTGLYENNNRQGAGELVKEDGEIRTENYKEGKLVNYNVTKQKGT
jgi:hypothetical protein